jgi:hypothetical protein
MKHIYLVDTDLDDVETAPPTSPRSIIVTTAPSSMWNTRHEYVNVKDIALLIDAVRTSYIYNQDSESTEALEKAIRILMGYPL